MAKMMQYIDLTVPLDDDGSLVRKEILSRIRPDWNPDQIIRKEMSGGFLNLTACFHLEREEDEDESERRDALIVRCYKDVVDFVLPSHDTEIAAMQAGHLAGCCGEVLATFNNGIVYEFVSGRNLRGDDITNHVIARLVARCMAQLHSTNIERISVEDRYGRETSYPKNSPFDRYLQQIDKFHEYNLEPSLKAKLESFRPIMKGWKHEIRELATLYEELGLTQALCHNDLHGRNIIYDEITGRLSLIDFECSSIGFVASEFAYFFNSYLHSDFTEGLAEVSDFPLGKGPVPHETRVIYARSYLERKYELRGHDPSSVTREEIEIWLIELELAEIVVVPILLTMSVMEIFILGNGYTERILEPFAKIYNKRKARLGSLQAEYKRLRSILRT